MLLRVRDAQERHLVRGEHHVPGAGGADVADEALRERAGQRGPDQEGRHAEVDEPGDDAHAVVGVEGGEDEVAGERRLHGLHRRLAVPHLADHDHVRVLPEHVAQRLDERGAGVGVGLDLVEALVDHLDRVLDGDHVRLGRGERLERGVEGRRLAAPGRARDDDEPVRPVQPALELLPLAGEEADLGEVLHHHGRVQDADDDLVAERGGDGGDAEIHLPLAARGADAPVLRAAAGDVEPRHHLEAVGERGVHGLGDAVDGVEHAVDAHADDRLGAPRLDVDVARPLLVRVEEEELRRGDHRLARRLERVEAREVDELLQVLDVRRAAADLVVGGVDRHPEAVDLGDAALDVAGRGEDGRDGAAGERAELLEQLDVEGVGDRDGEGPVLLAERQDAVLAGEGAGDCLRDELGVELEAVDLPVLEIEPAGDGGGGLVLVHRLGRGALAARVGEVEGGHDLDSGRSPPCRALARRAACARG